MARPSSMKPLYGTRSRAKRCAWSRVLVEMVSDPSFEATFLFAMLGLAIHLAVLSVAPASMELLAAVGAG